MIRILTTVLLLFSLVKGPELYTKFVKNGVEETLLRTYGSDIFEQIGIKFPNVVRAQIALETRWLSSKIYKENSNMFGMKESSRNWDCGTRSGHANYVCSEDNGIVCPKHSTDIFYLKLTPRLRSLYDYRDWQAMRFEQAAKKGMKIPETEEEYIYFLQHLPGGGSYAEDPLYAEKVRHITKL